MESNTDVAPTEELLVADVTDSLAITIAKAFRVEFKRPEFADNRWVNDPGYDE